MLKLGAFTGAALMLPVGRKALAKDERSAVDFTPYEARLKLPEVLRPVRSDATTDFYEITMREAEAEIIPGYSTPVWGYNGLYPGPTILAREERRVSVTHTNNLPVSTSVHHHGAYVDGDSDGHPLDLIPPGGRKEYKFGNQQCARTQWYHDHAMHITSTNVYKGLAGLYIIKDETEEALALPRGEYDVPLVIQDRLFRSDGSFFYPPDAADDNDGFEGDIVVVNGAAQPRFEVGTCAYRFRVLNGSNARVYDLAFSDGRPFTVIATEGSLLRQPVSVTTLPISPAERYEIVADFTNDPVGTKVVLENRRVDRDEPTREIMRFDVARAETHEGGVPDELVPEDLQYDDTHLPPEPNNVARRREFRFERSNSQFTINGLVFDGNRIDANPREGDTKVWTVYNNSGGWVHPVHIHLVNFKILDRNGSPPHPWETGWKDTVFVGEGEEIRLIMRWPKVPVTDEPGSFSHKYVFHCHNLEHEDHDMMAQIGVQTNDFTVSEVSADPPPGAYPDKQEITLTATDPAAAIFFTTDGRNPLPSIATRYTEPIEVEESVTIKAIAVDATGLRGPTATFAYAIEDEPLLSTLSLAASPATLVHGQSATLSGRLLISTGQPIAAERIEIEARPAGSGEFDRLGRVDTNPDGTFSLAGVKPQRNTEYRAVFEGDGSDIRESASPVVRVLVRARVSLNAAPASLKRGGTIIFSGVVAPGHAGKLVRLTIRRGGRVVANRSAKLNSASRYRLAYKPPVPGAYQVTATLPNQTNNLGAASPTRRFRVVR